MAERLIAVGNRLMSDEGIALKIAEKLIEELTSINITVILGETDADFCMDSIEENDFVIILDATFLGTEPGTISIIPISKYNLMLTSFVTQHDLTLLKLIRDVGKNISGYVIGIEVHNIDFNLELSSVLKNKFSVICNDILKIVTDLMHNRKLSELQYNK